MDSAPQIVNWLRGWERRDRTRGVVRWCLLATVLAVSACLLWANLLPTGVLGISTGIAGLLCYPAGDLIGTWWVARGMSDEQRIAVHILSTCLSGNDTELWRRSSKESPALRDMAQVLGAVAPETHEVVARFHKLLKTISSQERGNDKAAGGDDATG